MPTYDYVCNECGYEFEAFQSMTEEPLKKCPNCYGKVNRKIGTGAGLIFKGSGFYITDYKKSQSKTSTKSDKKEAADGSSKKSSRVSE